MDVRRSLQGHAEGSGRLVEDDEVIPAVAVEVAHREKLRRRLVGPALDGRHLDGSGENEDEGAEEQAGFHSVTSISPTGKSSSISWFAWKRTRV